MLEGGAAKISRYGFANQLIINPKQTSILGRFINV
jgi:hypothetical protein